MAIYQVRLVNSALNIDRTIEVPDDQYILDMAEEAGIRLPAGCREGTCSSCIAKILSGEVNQSEQKFLKSSEMAAGYTVTCVAYPMSDCVLETHQEQILYKSSLYFKSEGT
ncbi:MAG TPA: ferredoxin [Cyanobacteria bacterium UBA11149]|nr:ferredoxin [Cyanobacteria bacterium UBA11367]HBE60226.1 ferredoxin [Cyanobacteria bacterium UBA11366]HBK63300.1 ferredoxin [Cyanobacteria bacterium UBA11166]HBR73083.1 ferredoxin [Cyanobacteria bacterium UBA11159]HBS71195.1 ferredoxin [Cyanobacteria bacterium UBA11153]HBW91684.1 ferredoxin [Cyanobacteria bacterium UBA11149]HCA96586.1 ferredoxin [Cyanobacteria bacterium UBA9226]